MVTGVSSGIGLATALHLANLGFRTIGTVRRADQVALVAEAARRAEVEIEPVILDVADEESCERAMAGRELYGLVNNAGYFNVGTVEDVPWGEIRRQLDTMVVGPMHLARQALPAMRAGGGGRIINISSAMIHLTLPMTGWYRACNNALSAVSETLRIEVASSGVDVILVEPGAILTAIWDKAEEDLLRRRAGSRSAAAYDRALAILRTGRGWTHPPSQVAEVIGEALIARRPRTSYQAGRELLPLRVAGLLVPDRVRDAALQTVMRR